MSTDGGEPISREGSQKIVGAAMEVLNEVDDGFYEKPYKNSLVFEFRPRSVPCLQQKKFSIFFKAEKIREYDPDLIVFDKIIIDTKVIEKLRTERSVRC